MSEIKSPYAELDALATKWFRDMDVLKKYGAHELAHVIDQCVDDLRYAIFDRDYVRPEQPNVP